MRSVSVLCLLAAACLCAGPVAADVLKLSNGNQLTGALVEVEFLSGGKQVKYARADVTGLTMSDAGQDTLLCTGDKTLNGEVIAVTFKSVGGALPFVRKDIAGVTLGDDPTAAARKEFDAKKAALPANDAKAAYDLAVWCRDKGLKTEAAQMARQALTLDPNADFAAKAHEIAGDVLYKDKWLTSEEYAKAKAADTPVVDNPKPPDTTTTPKLTDDQLKAIKEAAAKNEELRKTYADKVAEMKKEDSAKVKSTFEKDWNDLKKKYDTLQTTIKRKQDARTEYAKANRVSMAYLESYAQFANDGLAKDKDDLKVVNADMARIAESVRSANSSVGSREDKRKGRVQVAYDRNRNRLLAGKVLTNEEMTAEYDNAVKLD